jgi:hypothetical protein
MCTNQHEKFHFLRHIGAPYLIWLIILLIGSCQQEGSDAKSDSSGNTAVHQKAVGKNQSQLSPVEKTLAGSNEPYLVFDLRDSTMTIKMAGTKLKDIHFTYVDNSATLREFIEELSEDSIISCNIKRLHLFAAAEKFGDTLVNIVSSATNVAKENIQHYIPQRMTIVCSNNLVFSVVTEIDGESLSFWQNQLEHTRLAAGQILAGAELVHLRFGAEDAMSLYGVSSPGTGIILRY